MGWTPPDGICVPKWRCRTATEGGVHGASYRSGLDIAKHVFQVHGADAAGHVLFRKRITRVKLLSFLAAQTRCVVVLEACAGAHYWAREIAKLGHHARLIAPA